MNPMLQQSMTAPRKIEFKMVDIPQPAAGQVLVKIMKIGVCGSDIHVYHGQHPFTKYPITQGHEVSGYIVALGHGVNGFAVGQKVTIEPQVYCGTCYPCTHGKYNLCEELKVMGFQTTGAASQYIAVDASKVTALPQSMSYSEGAMIEPLAVVVHAVQRAGDVRGKKIAVLGAGPIGILLAQCAKALGAAQVLITDVSVPRLEIAKACGVEFAIDTKTQEFGQALTECFGPDKADVIYDCAGNDITMGQAIRCARKGSTIILVAVYAGMATVDLALLNDHELTLNTSMMYCHEDYVEAIRLVGEGTVLLQPLMSRCFPFQEYLAAYEFIEANREATMKVLIDVDESEK